MLSLIERVPAKGRCLRLLLRIRSAHLQILGFPMGGAYLYRDTCARLKTLQRKRNLARALGIQIIIGGNHMHFSEIIKQSI